MWWVVAIVRPFFAPSKVTRPNQGGYALLQVTTQEFKEYQASHLHPSTPYMLALDTILEQINFAS